MDGSQQISHCELLLGFHLIRFSNCGRDEHFKRSPDCPFFTLINDHKPTATSRKSKAKKDRTSKASRLSTQSTFTATSEAASLADLPAEDEDSVLTTATNATATASETKMGKGKRATAGKGKKTKAKKSEAVEVDLAPEPEVDDLEVKEVPAPKATRGRKRKSDQVQDSVPDAIEADAPAPKRRTTRARGSAAIEDIATRVEESTTQTVAEEAPNSTGPSKAKRTVKSGRKPSAAKRAASVKAPPIPTDEEIEAALEADLDTVPDDEQMSPVVPLKNTSRSSKVSKADYAMFDTEPMEIDDAVIEAELEAIEAESTPPPKPKAARGRPRKASAKQPAAAKKATKVEAEAEARETEDELASEQITAELDNSISMHHTPPPLKPKKQRAVSRKVSRQAPARAVKAPALPVDDFSVSQPDDLQSSIDAQDEDKEDFGNDTNLSMASQSTVIRVTAPASKPKRGRPSKQRVASRKIEEASQKRLSESNSNITQATRLSAAQKEESKHERSMTEDRFYTPAPEFHEEVKEPTPEVIKPQAPRPRGRPPKVATASVPVIGPEQTSMIMNDDPVQEAQMPAPATLKLENVIAAPAVRSSTPPPIERKESQSPQSSDVENQPPSSKPSTARKVATPNPKPRIPLGGITPMVSPSKTNVIACLKSENPWSVVDLETIFLKTSGDENALGKGGFEDAMAKAKSSELTNPEKKMTVEEWILYNAEKAEEKLRSECERMVGIFEQQGTRAMMALEGVECTE